MGNLGRRLDNLERLSAGRLAGKWAGPRGLDSYFRALENLDREEAGLPPLPYTVEDCRDDERFLQETLPAYRTNRGWQTEEAQGVLDECERSTRARLQKGRHY
jgi:hypothetical protein